MLSTSFNTKDFHLERPEIDKQREEWIKKTIWRKKQEEAKRKAEEEERKRIEVQK